MGKKVKIRKSYIFLLIIAIVLVLNPSIGFPNPMNPFGPWWKLAYLPMAVEIPLLIIAALSLIAFLVTRWWKRDANNINPRQMTDNAIRTEIQISTPLHKQAVERALKIERSPEIQLNALKSEDIPGPAHMKRDPKHLSSTLRSSPVITNAHHKTMIR